MTILPQCSNYKKRRDDGKRDDEIGRGMYTCVR